MLEVRRTLHVLDANDDATAALDRAVRQNLKDTADRFPMGDVERQVANQVSELKWEEEKRCELSQTTYSHSTLPQLWIN